MIEEHGARLRAAERADPESVQAVQGVQLLQAVQPPSRASLDTPETQHSTKATARQSATADRQSLRALQGVNDQAHTEERATTPNKTPCALLSCMGCNTFHRVARLTA